MIFAMKSYNSVLNLIIFLVLGIFLLKIFIKVLIFFLPFIVFSVFLSYVLKTAIAKELIAKFKKIFLEEKEFASRYGQIYKQCSFCNKKADRHAKKCNNCGKEL